MKLQKLKLAEIEPYKNNPRKNDDAVNAVAESIRQCSYITPIIVDEDHVIIAGHTRYKALIALGMDDVECLICDGLDLCQYFGQKKSKDYAVFLSSSSSFCCGVK
jgi:ParB-like chromosome segregation protein Spo0J